MDPSIVLYDWPVSPFCMKVRAVLDHKRLPYRRLPALAHRAELRRRGGVGKVPAVELDGAFVVDSTDIAHALERRFPEQPILPADPVERARCHVLEDWSDESLYWFGLHHHWVEPAGRAAARAYFGRTWTGRLVFPWLALRIRWQLWGQGTGRKSPAQLRADLERNLDAVEGLLTPGDYLLGDRPWLCDFALMSQLVYLTRAVSLTEVLTGRPRTSAFLDRMKALRVEGG